VFHKIGTPLYFCNNILPCGPISIIDIPNGSAENWLKTCDTFYYLTDIYYLKIVTSHRRQYLRVAPWRYWRIFKSFSWRQARYRWRTVWTQDGNIYHLWYFASEFSDPTLWNTAVLFSKKLVVLLSIMRVMCYILYLQFNYAIQRIFIKYAIAKHIVWKQIS